MVVRRELEFHSPIINIIHQDRSCGLKADSEAMKFKVRINFHIFNKQLI